MKTVKSAIIALFLVLLLTAAPTVAQPVTVLLREGLYAEEIEGDLDAAIKIYEKILARAKEAEHAAAQATFRIGMCLLKKGDKPNAAQHFRSIVTEYPDRQKLAARAKQQLDKLGLAPGIALAPGSGLTLYEQLPPDVIRFVGNKYGTICAEAGEKKLYANSHVYYVTPDFELYKGGMGYYHNTSDRALFNKVRLSGTSYPNQSHYDIGGRKMNTEIVPDKVRANFYHIYWTPHEPVPPGQMFYYGWCINQPKQLHPASGPAQYKMTMQNQFGQRVMEAFFLIVPRSIKIVSRTENYTAKDTVGQFDIYSFSKEVPQSTNHQVDLVLAGSAKTPVSIGEKPEANLYEQLPADAIQFLSGKYGSISAEAGVKNLYSNSHIYFVTPDLTLLAGGMGYYHNLSSRPQGGKIRLSGTSDPDQTLLWLEQRRCPRLAKGIKPRSIQADNAEPLRKPSHRDILPAPARGYKNCDPQPGLYRKENRR